MIHLSESKLKSMSKAQLIKHIQELYDDKSSEADQMEQLLKMLEYSEKIVRSPYIVSIPASEAPYFTTAAPKMSNLAEQGLLIVCHNRLRATIRLIENDCIDEALGLLDYFEYEIEQYMGNPDYSKDTVEGIISCLESELSDHSVKVKEFFEDMLEKLRRLNGSDLEI